MPRPAAEASGYPPAAVVVWPRLFHTWKPRCALLFLLAPVVSLMALGTSSPEIMLALVEAILTLGKPAGELGPACIVGSAAYNYLMISAVCTTALPAGAAPARACKHNRMERPKRRHCVEGGCTSNCVPGFATLHPARLLSPRDAPRDVLWQCARATCGWGCDTGGCGAM